MYLETSKEQHGSEKKMNLIVIEARSGSEVAISGTFCMIYGLFACSFSSFPLPLPADLDLDRIVHSLALIYAVH
jgi:hypothetical protein